MQSWKVGILVLVGILGLPTIGLVATDHLTRQADLHQAGASNAQAATAVAYEVAQSVQERKRVFQGLPEMPDLAQGLSEGNRSLLERSLRLGLNNGQYCRVVLRSPGMAPVVVSTGPCWSPPPPPSGERGVHALGAHIVQRAAFSGWTVSGAVPGHPLASIQAIFPLRSLTAATIPGAGLRTTMVEGTTIVSSSVRGIVGKTVAVPASVAMIKAGRPARATIYAPLIHTKVIEAYRPVPGTGLGVFFSVSTSVAYAAANHARRVLLAGYLVLLATGFWLAGGVFVALRRRDRAREVAAKHYRSLAEATPDGVAIVDESGLLIYANPALIAMLGAGNPDTWHGHPMTEWINWPDDTAVSERALTIDPEDAVPDAIMELRQAGGQRLPVEGNAGPFDLGDRQGTIWVIRDLSRRHAAEAAVALAEVRQRATIETITDGIVVFDLADDKAPKPVLMNPAAKQFLGPPIDDPDETFNWFDAHVTGPDGNPFDPQQRPVAVVARTGKASTAVIGLTPLNGEHRWVRVTANPIIDRLGVTVGIVNSLVDITQELADRVKADADRAHLAALVQAGIESEQALRESEERFHMAFEHAPIGKSLISLDGHFEQANPALCRITGYSKEQLRHLTVADITHPDDVTAALAAMDRLLTAEVSAYSLEKRCLTATGAEIWVSTSMSLVRHEDGSPRHFIGQVQDITERKVHEEVLAVERRRLHAAQSIGRIGSWEMELATGTVAWSDTLLELYGLDRPASPEDLPSVMVWIHPDDRQSVQAALDACGRTGEPMYVRHRVIRADDGRLRWLDAHGEGIYEHGELVRLAGAVVDVTEQVLTARAAKDARDFAIEASRQKSAFLATMSHEIRTPMNAVIGMTGLLLDSPLDTNQRELVETVRTSGDALLGIINDILDFSKIEAGGLRLEQQPFDLSDCVGDALDVVSATPTTKGLELIGHIDQRCPTLVVGDVTRLRQVLVNLLSNAVKFTARGEVVLSVEPDDVEERGAPDGGDALRISVTDTGIGIAPDRIASLFESFSQVDTSTTRIYGGTGLGLAISQRLVEAMGGTLGVDSVTGVGSSFHFSIVLPRATPVAPIVVGDPNASFEGRSALLVHDNSTSRRILRLQLEGWGLTVTEAGGGAAALAIVDSRQSFDFAVVDMGMPGMSGQDLALALHEAPAAKRLPIILLTSRGDRLPSGPNDPLTARLNKPVRASRLHQHVTDILLPAAPLPDAVSFLPKATEGRRPLRVLLAEDNVVNQRLARLMLEKLSHHVDIVGNGLEAAEAVHLVPYDVVLMDVEMPVMDGLEATRLIRTTEPIQRQPEIVAMTASALVDDKRACYEAGMDDYLAKPVRLQELNAALERAADKIRSKKPTTGNGAESSSPTSG